MDQQSFVSQFHAAVDRARSAFILYYSLAVSMCSADEMRKLQTHLSSLSLQDVSLFLVRGICSLEEVMNRVLPPVNETDCRRDETMTLSVKLQSFLQTLIARTKIHGGLYLIVMKTKAAQVWDDCKTGDLWTATTIKCSELKNSMTEKAMSMHIAFTEYRLAASADFQAQLASKFDQAKLKAQSIISFINSFYSNLCSKMSLSFDRIVIPDIFAWSSLRIDDVAAWMSQKSSALPNIKDIKSQSGLMSAVDQLLPPVMSNAVQKMVQIFTSTDGECKHSNGADSRSTSSTDSNCTGNVTPANSDETKDS